MNQKTETEWNIDVLVKWKNIVKIISHWEGDLYQGTKRRNLKWLTWIAFAVFKRNSGEEYLIRSRFKKLSMAARMSIFWGLKDGFASLGLILKINNRIYRTSQIQ